MLSYEERMMLDSTMTTTTEQINYLVKLKRNTLDNSEDSEAIKNFAIKMIDNLIEKLIPMTESEYKKIEFMTPIDLIEDDEN